MTKKELIAKVSEATNRAMQSAFYCLLDLLSMLQKQIRFFLWQIILASQLDRGLMIILRNQRTSQLLYICYLLPYNLYT